MTINFALKGFCRSSHRAVLTDLRQKSPNVSNAVASPGRSQLPAPSRHANETESLTGLKLGVCAGVASLFYLEDDFPKSALSKLPVLDSLLISKAKS